MTVEYTIKHSKTEEQTHTEYNVDSISKAIQVMELLQELTQIKNISYKIEEN